MYGLMKRDQEIKGPELNKFYHTMLGSFNGKINASIKLMELIKLYKIFPLKLLTTAQQDHLKRILVVLLNAQLLFSMIWMQEGC